MKQQPQAIFRLSAYSLSQAPSDRKPQIAFGGRSNVGKSTLINTILGQRKLARTSNTPGRTQALNFFEIDDRYYFVDLPGYGFARAPLAVKEAWGKLVDGYLSHSKNLAGVVALLDCRRDVRDEDQQLFEWLVDKKIPYVVILTKTDKLSANQLNKARARIKAELSSDIISFSAKNGAGVKELWSWINKRVGA